MSRPTDRRLDELFVRYWDDALTPAEAGELAGLLSADPAAREWFQSLCLQAVVAAELPAAAGRAGDLRSHRAGAGARWSRRRVLRWFGGAAACTTAVALGWPSGSARAAGRVRLTEARGTVMLKTAAGKVLPAAGPMPPGATLVTSGPNSSAVLRYPNGSDISFTGDSAVTLAADGLRLVLLQGTATADVPPQPDEAFPLSLATAEATLARLSGVAMTLGRAFRGTEVGVQQGSVAVAAPSGEPMDVVRGGEILTVGARGNRHKERMPVTPDRFALDLSGPLPDDWQLGRREDAAGGPVLRPEFWFDPFHQAVMSQIRSNKQWAQGFFRLYPESVVRVRYRVDRPGPGQLVGVVRTARVADPATGCVEWNGTFGDARPRQWQWLEVKGKDLLDNIHAPRFGPPWVGFLLIFNTYKEDIGLRVAELRVDPPRGPAAAG